MKKEVKVGIFAFVSICVLIFGIVVIGQFSWFSSGYEIYVDFTFAGDLREGANVSYQGAFEAGRVASITITEEGFVRVGLTIEDEVEIPRNSKFAIYTVGLGLGEKYIIILPEIPHSAENLNPGDIVSGDSSVSLEGAVGILGDFAEGFSKDDFTSITYNVIDVISNLNALISDNKDSLSATLEDISYISKDARKSVNEVDVEEINQAIDSLNILASNLNILTVDINEGNNALGRIVNDDDIYTNLKEMLRNTKELTEKLNENPSLLIFPQSKKTVR